MKDTSKKALRRGHNEGNIRQRTDGRWEVRLSAGIDYKTGKPRRTSTCCNTRQEAIAILQQQAHEVRTQGWRDPMSVTLGEWYEYWLNTYMKDTPIRMEGVLRHVVTIEKSRLSIPLGKYGIAYSDLQQTVDTFFDSFYGITQSFSTANLTLEQYLQNNRPLVVYGEPGTAKPQMVRMLYAKGPLSNAPLVKIDCAMLMRPGWKYLMENDRSPLMGKGCTIMMSHVEALTDEQFSELFSTVTALHTQERNRMFFIASCPSAEAMPPHYARLVDMLNCLTLEMPPLRSHLQDIPRLSGLYISTLNMRNARAVIGFEPEATFRMTEYCWPGNYDQFCRVLNELVLRTTTPYISEATVREQLKRECTFYPDTASQTHPLPVDLTLEEIECIAVQQALQAENGNQKRAAERLGISRTTLWRMLQREAPNSAQKSGI